MPLQICIKNEFNAMSKMSEWIAASCESLGFSDALTFRIDLAANEVVANTISYGYPGGACGAIGLQLDVLNELAVLEIHDDGIAFNPLSVPEPPVARSLDEASIGGRGIPLIRKCMSHREYQRRDGYNILILRSSLTDVPPFITGATRIAGRVTGAGKYPSDL